ncbi:sigma-70 family RNA polymerase sigma factor [Streptomyces phaeochromogenes]|uniref:sigma-70 family RNA polymerase sigma factor n=1 Tax=Streptomyces phaeochromogenes TaxID=1923 RepID=UPI0036A6C6C2
MAEEERSAAHAEAVAELAAERYEQLVGYARKRLAAFGVPLSAADPEDVVQIALMKVLTCKGPIDRLRPYVFRVVKNEVSHATRHHRTGETYGSGSTDVQLETSVFAVDPCNTADLRMDLRSALATLSAQQRRAVLATKELRVGRRAVTAFQRVRHGSSSGALWPGGGHSWPYSSQDEPHQFVQPHVPAPKAALCVEIGNDAFSWENSFRARSSIARRDGLPRSTRSWLRWSAWSCSLF